MGWLKRLFNGQRKCRHLCPVCWPDEWKAEHHQRTPDQKFEQLARELNKEFTDINQSFRRLEAATDEAGEGKHGE